MGTLNSTALWSGLAVLGIAVPIIIHLLYRKHKRQTDWAAIELLRKAMVIRSGQVRLEDYLILFLRCLALALLGLALMRPTLNSNTAVPGGSQRVGAVIAIDGSYSMGHGKFETRFERGLRVARQVLDTLKVGDPVTLLVLGSEPRILLRGVGYDEQRFQEALSAEAQVLPERLNLAGCLEQLEALVAELKTPVRECYLISDAQANSWDALSTDEQARLDRLAKAASLFVVPVASDGEENLSITALNYVSGGLRRAETARFEAEVRNHGARGNDGSSVTFYLDGQPAARRALGMIGAGETRGVSFYAAFDQAGDASVDVRLSPDDLKLDNVRHAVVRVRDELRVLCVDGEPASEPGDGETWFLERALRLKQAQDDAVLKVIRIEAGDLMAENLPEFDVIILANVADPGAQAGERLASFVRRGGGLMVFGGDRVDSELYNSRLRTEAGPLLPAEIGEPILAAEDSRGFALMPSDADHALADLARRLPAELLDAARLRAVLSSTPIPEATVLLSVAEQEAPLLLERRLGAGHVLLMTTSADLEWGRMATHPLYTILLQQAVTHLSSDPARGQSLIGEPAVIEAGTFAVGQSLTVQTPAGDTQSAKVVAQDNGGRVCSLDPDLPGVYALTDGDGAVAVNIDAGEADVKALDSAALGALLTPVGAQLVSASELAGAIESSRVGRELSKLLLILALLIFILQSCLARHFTQRMRGGDVDVVESLQRSRVAAARRS